MNADHVAQTIILAAGSGSRLVGTSGDVPKPLISVAGVPLLAHALAHASASGCREAIIVVGHEQEQVKRAALAMESGLVIRFVETPDPSAPNGVSLLAAEPIARPHFFLQMVDHLFSEVALPKLVRRPFDTDDGARVLVDHTPHDIDLADATKVRLMGERVVAIGKNLEPWDAIDAGCFVLTAGVFAALREVPASEARTVSSGMRQLVRRGLLSAVSVDDTEWVDVDTPSDREAAERLLARRAAPQAIPSR
jgi:choline kinase